MNELVVEQLARTETDRMKGYKELLDFYYGKQWEMKSRRNERRLTFNYAKVFIEKVTSYLMGGMSFAVDPADGSRKAEDSARRAEAALKRIYNGNYLEQLDLETEIDCAVLGDGCYKVTWDAAEKRVRVTAPDVQGIYAWSAGDDTSRLWRVAARYQLSREEVEYLYGVKSKNKTAAIAEIWTDRDFELYMDNALFEAKANPYGFIPFVIFPNLREPKKLWGVSDLPQVMESQRELNRAMSQLSRILELSGNPIAVLENVEESEDIAVRPGAVWNIPEDAKAYLLDLLQGGGVSLHINYIDLVYRAMHDLSESPRSAFGGVERDMSGVALEIELQPLLQKVARKRIIRTAAYNRPFQSHTLPGTDYSEGLWREPVPFNCSCEYGLAMAHYGDYGWLASADGVWRALFDSQSLDLTSDVISLRQEIDGTAGMLEVELDNNDGKYASPGEDEIAVLDIDCQLEFSPGYRTTAGVECSGGQTYCVESIEHIVSGGKASVILRAYDGWGALSEWSARQQMRWNKTNSEYNVKDIIAVIIARVGIKLEVKSQSDTITNFYPDFTVNPNDNGKNTVQKLLSFVPDVVFIEGNKAYLVNPESDDTAEYSYGVEHIVLGGRYRQSAMRTNRVQVEGYDSGQGKMIVVDSFDWDDIERLYDRIKHVEDMNLNTAPQAYQRGEAILRKSEIDTTDGRITVPVNCGQQLYDVIEITDTYCGLTNAIRRVLGITLVYQPQRGEYFQRLVTGGV